jgi:hypothetical protein
MSANKETAAAVGIGAVACAACCAGPILAVLSAIGIGSAAGAVLFGAGALVVGAILAMVLITRRRPGRRRATRHAEHVCASEQPCCPSPAAAPVALSASRTAHDHV